MGLTRCFITAYYAVLPQAMECLCLNSISYYHGRTTILRVVSFQRYVMIVGLNLVEHMVKQICV